MVQRPFQVLEGLEMEHDRNLPRTAFPNQVDVAAVDLTIPPLPPLPADTDNFLLDDPLALPELPNELSLLPLPNFVTLDDCEGMRFFTWAFDELEFELLKPKKC